MWYMALVRLLRRRIVLALIFFLSLTYCLVNLLGHTSSSRDADEIVYTRKTPLVWRMDRANLSDSAGSSRPTSCRNSVQGRTLIVDEEGFVCRHGDLLPNGCCRLSMHSIQYDCHSCTADGCCAVYESCVCCCLSPDKRPILEQILHNANGRQAALFSTVRDQFELCIAKCRTDSHSVQHENKYKNPNLKFCYGPTEAHESQRDPHAVKGR